jgi:hypothetical protein
LFTASYSSHVVRGEGSIRLAGGCAGSKLPDQTKDATTMWKQDVKDEWHARVALLVSIIGGSEHPALKHRHPPGL